MIGQAGLEAVANDLRRYFFQQARPDEHHHNQGLARELLVRHGSEVSVEEYAYGMVIDYLSLQPSSLAAAYSLTAAITLYEHALDITIARGATEGTFELQRIIKTCKDEDICAFAAISLAEPPFNTYASQTLLRERLAETTGTSCRMALALALFQCYDEQPLRELVQDGYIQDYWVARENQDLNKYELQEVLQDKFSQFILRKLLQDIATNGMGVTGPLGPEAKGWKRNIKTELV